MPVDGVGDGPRDDYPKIPPTPVAITRYFNVFTAKVVALVLVLVFIAFHGIFHLKYGESKSNNLPNFTDILNNNIIIIMWAFMIMMMMT